MDNGSIKYALEYLSEGAIELFVMSETFQMSMKRGIKEFGYAGVYAVYNETKQLHDGVVSIPVAFRSLG